MTAACTTALITPGRGEVDGQDLVMDGTGMRERDESRVASRFFLTWDAWPGMLSSSAVHFQKLCHPWCPPGQDNAELCILQCTYKQ